VESVRRAGALSDTVTSRQSVDTGFYFFRV
jgi:hypothetical protein